MTRFVLSFLILLLFSLPVFSQIDSSGLKTAEVISSIPVNPKIANRFCFSFVTETFSAGKDSDLCYGVLRAGADWDWFQTTGDGSRNKIKSIGKKNWTNELKIPVVEPYAKLKPGERRHIVIGGAGDAGLPDFQKNESQSSDIFPNSLAEVANVNRPSGDKTPKSDYQPYVKAVRGKMYVMRVVDEKNDFYVLFRVDELERGRKAKISWKRIPAPQRS